ncbi:TadE/TadG family type IV pilus assembly protein [Segeticoccus rhizosphaerae]|uniref:TadE/TadG family type IV pilus assembly protein n=1 Tax=Segeticoccus rhizosphaerae TaxID=1104777 RepID=UPI0010C080F2|nr:MULTISPECIES: TadE family protein [Intrasporangiaceae]
MRRRRREGHDRGAAAVEMALVLPLLIVLLFGIIDFGRIYTAQIQLSQAAREGVRMESLGFPGDVSTRAHAAAPGLSSMTVAVTRACPAAPLPNDSAEVTVGWHPTGLILVGWIPGIDRNYPQTATMRCQG